MPTPDRANNPSAQIAAILTNAELQVKEIVAEAQRQSDALHLQARRELDERSAELAKIANELIASSAVAQKQLQRLNALGALTPPTAEPESEPQADAPAAAEPVVEQPVAEEHDAPHENPWSGTLASAPDPVSENGSVASAGRRSANGASAVGSTAPQAPTTDGAGAPTASASTFTADGAQWVTAPDGAISTATVDDDVAGMASVRETEDAFAPATDVEACQEDSEDLPIIGGSDHDTSPDSPERLDSARLVALSMAASGRSREEVEAHVRDELGIVDYAPLIDYVFGISAPASIVPSWPPRRGRRSA